MELQRRSLDGKSAVLELLLYAATDFICCADCGLDAACEVNVVDRGVIVETEVLEVA